jgi:hypothetical protein
VTEDVEFRDLEGLLAMTEHDGRYEDRRGRRRTTEQAAMTDSKSLAVLARCEKCLQEKETKEHDCLAASTTCFCNTAPWSLDRTADSLRLRKHGRTRCKRV